VTVAVGNDVAVAEPAVFAPVTERASIAPTSVAMIVYEAVVAPAIGEQPAPFASHRSHWYPKVIGGVPDHVPGSPVSDEPSCVCPVIVGADVFAGPVAVGVTSVSTTSCGAVAAPASRLRRPTAVELGSVIASVTVPFPPTVLVASMATQPLENPVDDPAAVAATAGAFAQAMVFSSQLVAAAARTARPLRSALVAYTRTVARTTGPLRPVTVKRTYERCTGEPSARRLVAVP
jgi:hypothetical protein